MPCRPNSAPCWWTWPRSGCARWGWRGSPPEDVPLWKGRPALPGGLPPLALDVGAAGQLQDEGVLRCWLADDPGLLDAAGPRVVGGKLTFDPAAVEAREAFLARRALAWARPVCVLVLGSSHDLGPMVRRPAVFPGAPRR